MRASWMNRSPTILVWHHTHTHKKTKQAEQPPITQAGVITNYRAFCFPGACLVSVGFDGQGRATCISKRQPSWATSAQVFQNKRCFRLRVAVIRHPRRLAAVWPWRICAIVNQRRQETASCKSPTRYQLKCSLIIFYLLFLQLFCVNSHRLMKC